MNIPTAYPVFEASQVLTSNQLNELTGYLEEQDRLSRRTLTGIGVLCGFKVDVEEGTVSIAKGVAVTSEGFLICSDAQAYDRFRPYEVPVPTAEEATEDEIAQARYPFLFPDGETQTPVFEMLDTDFVPSPGETDPTPLTAAFLSDKTVMLFLECRLESLRNCNINDCSDKGAERRFTLRRLLVTHAQADAMMAREAEIAQRPVDRNNHPRNDLPFLRVEKLALARTHTESFGDLLIRIVSIGLKLGGELPAALRNAYAAYGYLLEAMYAEGEDPFPDTYFSNVWGQLALNIFMVQYFYDYMRDVAMAYNEFVQTAACFEAECLPDPDRFPKHVMLGDTVDAPDAFATEFPTAADAAAFNQFSATAGAGLSPRPAARTTHFIPSLACQNQPRLDEVRALFLRMHLLALNFRLQGGMRAPIRVTPSKTGDAPLSDCAIPFHYAFTQDSDLFRNWSPQKVRKRLLNTVYSYQFSAPDDEHPLHFRLDDQDFIRIEGVVGKPLGSAMAELIAYKQTLGLSFSIEPVFMRLAAGADDQEGMALDQATAARALEALRRMLLCRMSDLDVIFLILIGALFALLVFLARAIGGLNPGTTGGRANAAGAGFAARASAPVDGLAATADVTAAAQPQATAFLDRETAVRFVRAIPPEQEAQLKIEADQLRADLRTRRFQPGDLIARLNPQAESESAAAIFDRVKDEAAGGNLFDRTQAFVLQQGGDEAAVQRTYAHTAMLGQIETLMGAMDVESIADFDEQRFSTAYRGFAQSFDNYVAVARATPVQDGTQQQTQAQILSAASAVTGQVGAFAAGNLQAEFTAAVRGLFENLTLPGFARGNPGLEHGAGVPVGGTYVVAYASLADLVQQLEPILTRNVRSVTGLTAALAPGGTPVNADTALTELTAAAANRVEDPLDDFIVLADFCLPYQCCDSDCSDVVLSERISADPFGEDIDPGPMAVPPVDGSQPDPSEPGRVPGAIGNLVSGDLTTLIRGNLGRISTAEVIAARGATGLPTRPTGFTRPTRRPTQPTRPVVGRTAAITGMVGIQARNTVQPVRESAVLIILPDGTERREPTINGRFNIEVPAGAIQLRGQATRHRGRTESFELRAGESLEVNLIVTPTN